VNDSGLVGSILNLTSLCVLDCQSDIGCDRANFWVGHQATWPKNLAQLSDQPHGVRRCNDDVKIQIASLDALGEVVHADNLCPGGFGLLGFLALSKNRNARGLASARWQYDGTANELVGFLRIDAKLYGHIHRLSKLRGRAFFGQAQGLIGGVVLCSIHLGAAGRNSLG